MNAAEFRLWDVSVRPWPIETESVHCIVTSPPYFALRDYGVPASAWPAVRYRPLAGHDEIEIPAQRVALGLETNVAAYIGHCVQVFREAWRVLRPEGTLWLVLGDKYDPRSRALVGSPWRLALALQADGWILRRDCIWAKPAPLPETVRDRPMTAHEYLFLFSKSKRPLFWKHPEFSPVRTRPPADCLYEHRETGEVIRDPPDRSLRDGLGLRVWVRKSLWQPLRYYYDDFALLERSSLLTHGRGRGVNPRARMAPASAWNRGPGSHSPTAPRSAQNPDRSQSVAALLAQRNRRSVVEAGHVEDVWQEFLHARLGAAYYAALVTEFAAACAEAGDVFWCNNRDYRGPHTSVFPIALAELALLGGCPERVCAQCGSPYLRIDSRGDALVAARQRAGANATGGYDGAPSKDFASAGAQNAAAVKRRILAGMRERVTRAWRPTCDCNAEVMPGLVLDCFAGGGTTAVAARRLGRRSLNFELKSDYLAAAEARVANARASDPNSDPQQPGLFPEREASDERQPT